MSLFEVLWIGLFSMIVAFPGHTKFLFVILLRVIFFCRSFQGGASFVVSFVICVSCLSLLCCLVYSLQPCDHLLGKV